MKEINTFSFLVPGTKAPVPCPAHSCTKENLGCVGELAKDSNNCDLCQCAGEMNQIFAGYQFIGLI